MVKTVVDELLVEDMVNANNELLKEKTTDMQVNINGCELSLISHPLSLFASSLCYPRSPY